MQQKCISSSITEELWMRGMGIYYLPVVQKGQEFLGGLQLLDPLVFPRHTHTQANIHTKHKYTHKEHSNGYIQ